MLDGKGAWFLPLGFPRGEAGRLDGSSEPARLTDEGQRQVGCRMQLDGVANVPASTIQQGNLKLWGIATPHQSRELVPKCQFTRQLPPGGSQGVDSSLYHSIECLLKSGVAGG